MIKNVMTKLIPSLIFPGLFLLFFSIAHSETTAIKNNDLLERVPIFWEIPAIPVLSIYHSKCKYSEVETVVYSDGTIIWRTKNDSNKLTIDQVLNGVKVYYKSVIPKDRIDAILKNLEEKNVFVNPGTPPNMDLIPLDSNNTIYITINTPEKHVQLISNHRQFEREKSFHKHDNTNVRLKDGQTTYSLLLQEPFEYQTFRKNFDLAMNEILSLVHLAEAKKELCFMVYRVKNVNPLTQKIVLREGETDSTPLGLEDTLRIDKKRSPTESRLQELMHTDGEKTKAWKEKFKDMYEYRK